MFDHVLTTLCIIGLAWAILPHDWNYYLPAIDINFRPWRMLLIVYALPSLVVAAMLSVLPERLLENKNAKRVIQQSLASCSPKFLLSQGKHEHTLRILTKMFVSNTGRKAHEYPVSTIIMDEVIVQRTTEPTNFLKLIWNQTVYLFKREYILKTALICYLQFGVFLS